MQKGNVTRAIKILRNNKQNRILPLNRETLNHLKLKLPEGKRASAEVLLDDVMEGVHPLKFETIDEESLRQAALHTKGGSGLLGLNAGNQRKILILENFSKSNSDLRKAIARSIKNLRTSDISFDSFRQKTRFKTYR